MFCLTKNAYGARSQKKKLTIMRKTCITEAGTLGAEKPWQPARIKQGQRQKRTRYECRRPGRKKNLGYLFFSNDTADSLCLGRRGGAGRPQAEPLLSFTLVTCEYIPPLMGAGNL